MNIGEEKVFKDPIHQYIYVQDNIIWDLINTPEFQRLRRIKQLGTSFFTYHGAEHSRFSHSLGVYEITRKIISQFERNKYEDWPKSIKLLALITALLHDIGHGPFSHSIENVFNINHEEWTKKIVLGETEINTVLKSYDKKLPEDVVSVLNKTYDKAIVIDIISSQLDADRMDYLLRDAYYTGVNYGTFDIERILRVLRPFNNKLVVKKSGMHSVEDYLMARYQMYSQVYFHPVTKSGDIILKKIFRRAQYLFNNGYHFEFLINPLKNLFAGVLGTQDYLQLDDSILYFTFSLWTEEKDKILADLSQRFINRRLFKYIELKNISTEKEMKIKAFLQENGIEPLYYFELDSPTDLHYDLYRPGDNSKTSPIYLLDGQGKTIEISQESEIIASIIGTAIKKNYIFFPMDLLKEKLIDDKFKKIF